MGKWLLARKPRWLTWERSLATLKELAVETGGVDGIVGQEPSPKVRRWERRHPLEPELVLIPAGKFWMGTDRIALEPAGVKWDSWFEREAPYHQVYLPAYAIGKYPVTNAEFIRFIEDGGYGNSNYWTKAGWRAKEIRGWTQPYWERDEFNDPSQPMVGVSWYEVVAYCNWLAAKVGKPYHLPTEAEWEKAARGTDGRLWPWGNKWDPDRCNTRERGLHRMTPVGTFPEGASPYGCLDMVGNAWEWTSSQFKKYPYEPADGRESLEAEDDVLRVVRGGSFVSFRNLARCAFRFGYFPYFRYWIVGFRVCV